MKESPNSAPPVPLMPHKRKMINGAKTTAVIGSNFSGRTALLQEFSGVTGQYPLPLKDSGATYIRPEISLSVSTFRPSVYDEVHYHLNGDDSRADFISRLLEMTKLTDMLEQNPTTLSGGEQAALVLISKLALRPKLLAVDCALEQLATSLKDNLLEQIQNSPFDDLQLVMADNRFSESNFKFESCIALPNSELISPQSETKFEVQPINPSIEIPFDRDPCTLELADVSFAYTKQKQILGDLNVKFEPGKIHVIQGQNGAGKSTLAKLICGVEAPGRGRILVNGKSFNSFQNPGHLAVYHFQDQDVQFVAKTVQDDVRAAPDAQELPIEKRMERMQKSLDAFGLTKVGSADILDLPVTLRKRIALAGVVAAGAPWMIFDEPGLGQDDQTCALIAECFKGLAKKGIGLIIISHSPTFVNLLNAQSFLLQNGKLDTKLNHSTL